jgi:hypothetical protein
MTCAFPWFGYVINMLSICYEYVINMLSICYQYVINVLSICYQYVWVTLVILLYSPCYSYYLDGRRGMCLHVVQVCYQYVINMLSICYQYVACAFTWFWQPFHSSTIPTNTADTTKPTKPTKPTNPTKPIKPLTARLIQWLCGNNKNNSYVIVLTSLYHLSNVSLISL